jgi:hypothetical protein
MAALNIPPKDLMYIMGHRELSTNLKYYVKAKSEEIEKRITSESRKLLKIAELILKKLHKFSDLPKTFNSELKININSCNLNRTRSSVW